MKIAILGISDASNMYSANLLLRGHTIVSIPVGDEDHPPRPADMIEDILRDLIDREKVDGVLQLRDGPEPDEIATLFSRRTGRPVWRELTEIPR